MSLLLLPPLPCLLIITDAVDDDAHTRAPARAARSARLLSRARVRARARALFSSYDDGHICARDDVELMIMIKD